MDVPSVQVHVMLALVVVFIWMNLSQTDSNEEVVNITNIMKDTYYNVTVIRGAKPQYRYITVRDPGFYRYREWNPRYVHPFYLGKPRGQWLDFKNVITDQFGWATRLPAPAGAGEGGGSPGDEWGAPGGGGTPGGASPGAGRGGRGRCTVMSPQEETSRLVQSFINRSLTEDKLIMLSVLTYINDMKLDIRIGNQEYQYGSDLKYLPFPFAFLKGDFERDFKYLPIRLDQFRPLVALQRDHHIREYYYELTAPRQETVALNITGACWRRVSVFTDHHGRTHIGPISAWVRDAIMAHLINVLSDVTARLKRDHGLMWRSHFMNDVCYVESREPDRYSVPFHLRQCCAYSQRSLTTEAGDRYTLPLVCRSPEDTFRKIRLGIVITVFLVFGLIPLIMYIAPSKPRPYKKLRKETRGSDRETCAAGTTNRQNSHNSCERSV